MKKNVAFAIAFAVFFVVFVVLGDTFQAVIAGVFAAGFGFATLRQRRRDTSR